MRDFKLKKRGRAALAACTRIGLVRIAFVFGTIYLIAVLVGVPRLVSQAQSLYVPVKVSGVSSQISPTGSLVIISADTTLARAQTWQDEEGFHVVLPNTISTDSLKPGPGVKIRRIGGSLEILAQTKPGTRVSISSAQNQLSLIIEGKLETRPIESSNSSSSPAENALLEDPKNFVGQPDAEKLSSPVASFSKSSPAPANSSSLGGSATLTVQNFSPGDSHAVVPVAGNPAPAAIEVQAEDESLLASIFSGTSVLIVLALGLFGLLVSRKVRSKEERVPSAFAAGEQLPDSGNLSDASNPESSNSSLVRVAGTLPASRPLGQVARTVSGPTSLFGAYRIDQEVGKLILGQPHRTDVLASRAVDDRRAVEASLIKGLNSTELDESAKRRASEALEEYGFVARLCAALLLAPDAFERTSAARALGEIKSPAALPFLLEGLYDSEPIVRNQVVLSIGELKMPSAIGALLDIARTHPDVPSSLLSRTLSACSVEGLDFFDSIAPDTSQLGPGDVGSIIEEITHLEPSPPVESLPSGSDDELFVRALSAVESSNVDERSAALKTLTQFRVQSAVDAIAKVARHDPESTVRSLAISSLGSINHESVFETVLIGMADDSREVRAAAARSVSRLSFDRADAYVRVIETSDAETLGCVARACIQAGIVSQNLDRLTNADHRQAYETFSLISLLTKAGMNEPVLEAIANHPRVDVRLKAVHLLGRTGHPDVFGQLRELAVNDGVGEVVKTALLEALYRLDQNRLEHDEIFSDSETEHDSQMEPGGSEPLTLLEPDYTLEVPTSFDVVLEEADEL